MTDQHAEMKPEANQAPPVQMAVGEMCRQLHVAGLSVEGLCVYLPPAVMDKAYDEFATNNAARKLGVPLTMRLQFAGSWVPELVVLRRGDAAASPLVLAP